jgi:hypothetical protein
MIEQTLSLERRKKTEEKRRLALLLRRELALKKDELMNDAKSLVEVHFSNISNKNYLKPNQLKNLEGVAFTALNIGEITKFIAKQSDKEKDKSDKKWKHNDLNKKLTDKINRIAGRQPGKTTGDDGNKDEALKEVKSRAAEMPPVSEEVIAEWFSKDRELEVQLELLRDFVSYFATFYALEAGEQEEEG